jgi:zinc protease
MRQLTSLPRLLFAAALASALLGAAPAHGVVPLPAGLSFAPATQVTLRNGVIIASQPAADLPIVNAQIFIPAGLAQQPAGKAGIAAVTASLVLQTPVEGKTTLEQAVASTGGSISYTLDPLDTRYSLETRDADFARLLHDVCSALRQPDTSQLAAQRATALAGANALTSNPLETAYAMIREVRYHGTGFALPDQGSSITIASLSQSDVSAYVASYSRGSGTVVALEGAVTQAAVDAATREFGDLPAATPAPAPTPNAVLRMRQVVARRSVASPWVAVAYEAPSQYSADFATMLVIEAMLGSGGDVHALNYASDEIAPQDFIGAYYQYEATPGSMIVFLGGESENLDQSVRDLETGIARLRGANLSNSLIAEAKKTALGDYYLSATRLDDLGWLLGRSAASPEGVAFENNVPQRILSVGAPDIQRVARRYLTKETIAIVLPQAEGQ